MSTSSVSILMSNQTVATLLQSGFTLYTLKAVQTKTGGSAPLIWYSTQNYSSSTDVIWMDEYTAYTSTSQIVPNGTIVQLFSAPIALGQTLQVQQGGSGTVSGDGTPGAILIVNQTSSLFTTGIGQATQNGPAPVCVLPLYGNMLDVATPVNQVLLMFSTLPVNPGAVIVQAFAPGLLVDLTGVSSRSVMYDINTGWSANGASWARQIPTNSSLVPLLIQSPYGAFGAGEQVRAEV